MSLNNCGQRRLTGVVGQCNLSRHCVAYLSTGCSLMDTLPRSGRFRSKIYVWCDVTVWSDEPFVAFISMITEIYCYIGMHVSICSVIIRNQLWLILHWSQIKSASVNLYRYVPGQSLGRRKDYIKICFLKHFLISKSIFHNKSKR